ncbi:glycosyl hydrolase family 28-related protein [Streptomyces sp. T028]|uniref:glycosyl hydrolase family 28-related protein n=1 Tax=Streptomyces sp. T028 TaxID=3394379 RepID=UPI003A8C6A13
MSATTRRSLLAGASGLTGAALATSIVTAQRATAADTGAGWLNVRDTAYGALGDDKADDAPAIQKAIDTAGQGGTVYLPPGTYRLASPLRLRLGVTLRGDWNPHFPVRTNMTASYLRPGIGNFTGEALIVVDPAPAQGTYENSAYGGGPRLHGLALDGRGQKDSTGTAVDGIRITPGVKDVGMDKVTIWRFTGHGLNAQNAAAFQLNQVHTVDNDGHGFTWGDSTGTGGGLVDADLFQCYSQGNNGHGYDILNPNAVTMVDCRSEWNAQHGYHITGINYSMVMIGCNTDRNGRDGFHLASSPGGRFLQLLGCLAKRDGKETATSLVPYSGFTVTGESAEGVVLTGCSTSTGRDDDNTGAHSPAYGITTSALNSVSNVSVVGGEYVGTTAPFQDLGAVVVRHSGVISGTHKASGIEWDKHDVHMISGAAGTPRDLEFWTRGKSRRWTLRTTDAAESGSGDGSDFALVRHSDDGTVLDTPLTVSRTSGRVALTTPGVTVNASADPGVNVIQNRPSGQGYAITGADTASRAFQSRITGDTVNRFAMEINGTQTFGPGGSTGRDTSWGRLGTAQIGSADADIVVGLAGKGIKVKEGTNAKMGTVALNGTTPVTVPTTAVTATSRIFLTVQSPAGTPSGVAYVASRTPGTSFTVKGMAGDTSTVAWLIVDPA